MPPETEENRFGGFSRPFDRRFRHLATRSYFKPPLLMKVHGVEIVTTKIIGNFNHLSNIHVIVCYIKSSVLRTFLRQP